MSLVVIGLNHRTAPLSVLERMTVVADAVPKALHDLASRDNVSEVVLLSTCNRTEIYLSAERFHAAYAEVRDFLAELGQLAVEDVAHLLYSHFDTAAVTHLFSVAAGLDSAVLGESEILGQVRGAWEMAQVEETARVSMNMLFRHAVEVGKRARTETSIGRHITSVSQAAVQMVMAELGSVTGRSVLVLGAGDMGEGMVLALADAGARSVEVANRTRERAMELAARVGGSTLELAQLRPALERVDVLLTSTGARSIMLEHADIAAAMSARNGRPLLIVDIAVPRDVDPAVAELDGVTLYDLDDLRQFAEHGLSERRGEISAVQDIIEVEVLRYLDSVSARAAAPLIAQMHEHAESLRVAELDRHRGRLASLDPSQWAAVEHLTRAMVAKLLHDPTVRLKDVAGSPRAERLSEALRELFDLS